MLVNRRLSAELVDVERQLALEVGSLVLGDGLLCGHTVEHSDNLGVSFLGGSLVGHSAETTHGVAGGLCVVTVAKATAFGLADTF